MPADVLSKKRAWEVVGGLSRTSKMPCHSWGIPAKACQVGGILAKVAGSVCKDCYALRHAYAWRGVQEAYERRLTNSSHPEWVPAMTKLVGWQAERNNEPYFRWFDSGDLQSPGMLERIAAIAEGTPSVRHWLPTKEHGIVRAYLARGPPPQNLVIRPSAPLIDGPPPSIHGLPTSTVHKNQPAQGYECPAYTMSPAQCGDCRACWDPGVRNVSYPWH